ncbi:hypothetical protein A2164_03545, partial [Candidatus Curtissbacteria bacterium RBG_13_35_7]
VCQYNEVPEAGVKRVKVGEKDIALIKLGGQIYALSNICTHEGCYINENFQMHFDVVECMCHGSQFEVKTGNVMFPPATEGLQKYRAEVVGDDIYLEI